MIRILIVVLAYILIASCSEVVSVHDYYLSIANAYAAIAAMSILFAITHQSKILLAYFAVNILYAYFSVIMISDAGYNYLAGFIFDWPVTFGTLVTSIEIILVLRGCFFAWDFINSDSDNSNCIPWFRRLG